MAYYSKINTVIIMYLLLNHSLRISRHYLGYDSLIKRDLQFSLDIQVHEIAVPELDGNLYVGFPKSWSVGNKDFVSPVLSTWCQNAFDNPSQAG